MYLWRELTPEQQEELLEYRRQQRWPWHSPPHLFREGQFHLTSACFEHAPHIGREAARLADFSSRLMQTLEQEQAAVFAWCVLPNHYHLLAETLDLRRLKRELGRLHGRTLREWNSQEQTPGRAVWYRCADRAIRSARHYWATINYIHHNPVHHGYAQRWTQWPFSSAQEFIDRVGQDHAAAIWREYPVLDYGQGWDDPQM
jgi:putative transposase